MKPTSGTISAAWISRGNRTHIDVVHGARISVAAEACLLLVQRYVKSGAMKCVRGDEASYACTHDCYAAHQGRRAVDWRGTRATGDLRHGAREKTTSGPHLIAR